MTTTESLWAEPPGDIDPDRAHFYHAFEFPDGEVREGDWDLRGREADYSGHVDVSGKRVIDVGAASGFMSFAFERMGAEVVSADVASAAQYTKVPYHDEDWAPDGANREAAQSFFERMLRSYWYAHRKFGSQARVHHGDLHALPEALGRFDVGFMGQIMVHNRDPLGLLGSMARLVDETLILSEGMIQTDNKVAALLPDPERKPRPHAFLRFSTGAMRAYIELMGFEIASLETSKYLNVVHGVETPITTIVAHRR